MPRSHAMSLSNLPAPVLTLLQALRTRDGAALRSALSDKAVLCEGGQIYEGSRLLAWFEERFFGEPRAVQPIDERRSQGHVVLTLATDEPDHSDGVGDLEQEWTLAMNAGEIATIAVERLAVPPLPAPIAAYVRATNKHDLEALLAAFHDNALVNDQLRDHWGKEAIRTWAEQDVIGADLTMHVVRVVEHHGHTVVTAHVNGSFDRRGLPDPLVLTFYFFASTDRIVLLIILRNETHV